MLLMYRSKKTRKSIRGDTMLTLFVGGLWDKITTDDLSNYFEKFGTITDAVVMYDKTTRMARGFGFVTFDSLEAAYEILKNSFHFINGTKMETKNCWAKSSKWTLSLEPCIQLWWNVPLHNLSFYSGPFFYSISLRTWNDDELWVHHKAKWRLKWYNYDGSAGSFGDVSILWRVKWICCGVSKW